MWTSTNKKLSLFLGIIFTIGIILGFIFLIYLDEANKEIIYLNINEWLQNLNTSHINNIVSHIAILSSLFILSLFMVGIPLSLFFVFYNGFSIGFLLMALIDIFGIKGLLYGLVYVIITKGIYLFLALLFVLALIKIAIMFLKALISKEKINKDSLSKLLKRIFICIAIILISDVILYFGGTKLINVFNFLIF